MKLLRSKYRGVLLLYVLTYSFISCKEQSEITVSEVKVELPNGKIITVEKTNKNTKSIGYFTGNDYGTTHSFSYQLFIEPDDISWNGYSGEPKNILYCKEETYIRYLIKESIVNESLDSISNQKATSSQAEIIERYQKLVDKRYFFKLFGDFYWVNVDAGEVSQACEQYDIPNDGILSYFY